MIARLGCVPDKHASEFDRTTDYCAKLVSFLVQNRRNPAADDSHSKQADANGFFTHDVPFDVPCRTAALSFGNIEQGDFHPTASTAFN